MSLGRRSRLSKTCYMLILRIAVKGKPLPKSLDQIKECDIASSSSAGSVMSYFLNEHAGSTALGVVYKVLF